MTDLRGIELNENDTVLIKQKVGFNDSQVVKGKVVGFTNQKVKVEFYDEWEGGKIIRNLIKVVKVTEEQSEILDDILDKINILSN